MPHYNYSRISGKRSFKVAVSLPTCNRPRILGRCVAALLNQTFRDFEILIVYDGEPVVHPETAHYLSLLAKNHRLTEIRGTGYGQVYAHNLALYQSDAELILRLDDDVLLHTTALEQMVEYLDQHQDVGAVGGLWFNPGERRSINPGVLERFKIGNIQTADQVAQAFYHPTDDPLEVEHLYSVCLYRAEDMRRVGGWPMVYSPGVHHREETDGTYRLLQSGKKLVVLPSVTGIHLQSEEGGIRTDLNWFGKQELDDRLFREERLPTFVQMPTKPKVAVWSEHSINIAGGERHFYGTVQALQESGLFDVWYFGKDGTISIEDIKRYHGLDVKPNPPNEPEEFDLQVNISHYPIAWKKAKHYLAMIMFPGADSYDLNRFDRVYGNSKFTAKFIKTTWNRFAGVIYPPLARVPQMKKKNLMVAVGWFSPKKGLLSAIEAFRKAQLDDWQLVVFGDQGFEPTYEEKLMKAAAALPNVEARKKISYFEAKELLGQAKILGGFGGVEIKDTHSQPFYSEHFGMTPGEAMGAGAIPVLYNSGGYLESCDRFLYNDLDEAAELIKWVASLEQEKFQQISEEIMEESKKFSYERFKGEIVDACLQILYGGVTKESPYTIGEPTGPNLEPKVSVVIPNYNLERYLPEAIESTLCQTRRDFETIVVDDGSEGDTEAVIDYCGSGRVILVRQENQGLAAARNTGIKVAEGLFILPLDSDDFLAGPEILEKLVPIAEQNPHSILYSDVILQYVGITKLLELRDYDFGVLLKRDFMAPTALFPRQAWVESGGYKDFGPGFEDWELWITLGELEYFGVKVDFPIYHYRQRTDSMLDEANASYDELITKMEALHPETYTALARGQLVAAPIRERTSIPSPVPGQMIPVGNFLLIVYHGDAPPHNVRGPITSQVYRIRSGKPIKVTREDAERMLAVYPGFVLAGGAP